jgi:hypothetical protein
MEDFGIFLEIWSILWPLGIFCGYVYDIYFSVLVCCTKKNLATLSHTQAQQKCSLFSLMCVV